MAENDHPLRRTGDELRKALADLVRDAPPAVSRFASYALERPEDIAFYSLRAVAERAGVNANTVYRFSVALGYRGYEACRRNFQETLVSPGPSYGARAQNLIDHADADLIDGIRRAAFQNLETMLEPARVDDIRAAAAMLRAARQVVCVGVRSSFALAHYLSYTGGMAFPHFARPVVEVGGILDTIARTEPGDVAVLVTFSRYSREVLDAHAVALEKGVRVIALTDSYASPIARGAELVFKLPMQGPQTLPSLSAGFVLVEAIVNEMISADPDAPARVAISEDRLLHFGVYSEGRGTS